MLVAGSNGLRLALRERGMRPVSLAADRPVAVVQGYAPGINYELLAEAGVAVRDGAFYVATNSDSTLPTPRGPQPGNGSLLAVIITATGVQPVVAGKPQTPLHAEAVERTGAKHPLVVGDRLDTDIEGAVRGGADSLLVLTGVSTAKDAVLAPAGQRPTYIAADLRGLIEPQPVIGPRGSARPRPADGADADGTARPDSAAAAGVPLRRLAGRVAWRNWLDRAERRRRLDRRPARAMRRRLGRRAGYRGHGRSRAESPRRPSLTVVPEWQQGRSRTPAERCSPGPEFSPWAERESTSRPTRSRPSRGETDGVRTRAHPAEQPIQEG